MTTAQLDLFDDRERALLEWQARFERAWWIAPYDTQGGTPKGGRILGWRCPDPDCGQVEPNAYLLSINHGFDPTVPGHQRYDGRCARLALLRCQAEARREREARQ